MAGDGFIRIDDSQIKELDRLFSGFLPKEISKAKRTALSRTRRGSKARVSQLIRTKGKRNYNIPAKRAKKGISVTPLRNESFRVIGSTKAISLTSFSGTRDLVASGRGVSVAVIEGQRTRIATAFIRQPTGGPQVFRRAFVGGQQVPRRPIKRLFGPSIATMMDQNDAESDLADFLNDRFDSELKGALRFALRRRR